MSATRQPLLPHELDALPRGGEGPSLNMAPGENGAVAFSIGASSVGTQEALLRGAADGDPDAAPQAQGRNTGFVGACFLLMNAILGSGLLGQAFAAAQSGIGLYAGSLLVMAGCAFYAIVLLLLCCEMTGVHAYEAVGFAAYGPVGRTAAAVVVTLQNFGAMSGYLIILKDLLPSLVAEAGGFSAGEGPWWSGSTVLVLAVVVCLVWPLTMLRDIGALSVTSGFSITTMFFFTLVILIKFTTVSCTEAVQRLDLSPHLQCHAEAAIVDVGFAEVFPTLAFSFVCHTALLPIYTELRTRTVPAMMKVAGTSIALCFGLYLLAGIFGYLAFRGATQGDLLKQFAAYDPKDDLVLACRVLVAASVTLTIPLINYPARKAVIQTFWFASRNTFSWLRHIAVGTATLALVTLIALTVPSITAVFGVVGCTTSVGLVFVMPALFYLRITRVKGVSADLSGHRLGAMCMLVGGITVGAASLAGVSYKLATSTPA